jgi:4-coumarate--CoA ligase
VDDDRKDVEEGKPGEVLVKGPVVTNGYYGNPQATKESFVDGWFCTGDIAIVSAFLQNALRALRDMTSE